MVDILGAEGKARFEYIADKYHYLSDLLTEMFFYVNEHKVFSFPRHLAIPLYPSYLLIKIFLNKSAYITDAIDPPSPLELSVKVSSMAPKFYLLCPACNLLLPLSNSLSDPISYYCASPSLNSAILASFVAFPVILQLQDLGTCFFIWPGCSPPIWLL